MVTEEETRDRIIKKGSTPARNVKLYERFNMKTLLCDALW